MIVLSLIKIIFALGFQIGLVIAFFFKNQNKNKTNG